MKKRVAGSWPLICGTDCSLTCRKKKNKTDTEFEIRDTGQMNCVYISGRLK